MSVTIKQIAEVVGCSSMTVSLVLNTKQYHRVSAAMRERIEAAAQSIQYKPNTQAQALVSGKTRNIAATVVSMNPFYVEYVRKLTRFFEAKQYNVFAFKTFMNPQGEKEVVDWIMQGSFSGCICLECNQWIMSQIL